MQLFLLAVIMRQVAILTIILLSYDVYKLWTSEKLAKKIYKFCNLCVYDTVYLCNSNNFSTFWF